MVVVEDVVAPLVGVAAAAVLLVVVLAPSSLKGRIISRLYMMGGGGYA